MLIHWAAIIILPNLSFLSPNGCIALKCAWACTVSYKEEKLLYFLHQYPISSGMSLGSVKCNSLLPGLLLF